MKKLMLFVVLVYGVLLANSWASSPINGIVTAKRGDSVQVTFEPHETAGPKVGDAVSFTKEIPGTGGIKAKAGEGTVTEIDGATVWVKTSDNRPNLKMDAVIQATGDPLPKEYTLSLEGYESNWGKTVMWHPNGVFRFQYSTPLIVKENSVTRVIEFPEGAYIAPPDPGPAFEKTHKTHHLEELKQNIELNTRESDGWQVANDIVWSGREVKGRNTVFLVSQIIETERYFKDRKILSEDKNQKFLISFELPMPTMDSRTFVKMYWYIEFNIPDYFDEQFRPAYWEKVCLDILKSASVDLRGGKLKLL